MSKEFFEDFKKKDIENITEKDLNNLFEYYDNLFDNQLSNKINGSKSTKIRFKYEPSQKTCYRLCGIVQCFNKKENIIYFDILPWIPIHIKYIEEEKLKVDKMSLFLRVFEHNLIHLLCILWNHANFNEDSVYGVHGSLFNCMVIEFFPTSLHIYNTIYNKKFITPPPSNNKMITYNFKNNSCYLDSLLTTLLLNKSNVFRNHIFSTNLDNVDYNYIPCLENSVIKNKEDFRKLSKDVQVSLLKDYYTMISANENNLECSNIRKLLKKCFTDMTEGDIYTFYNVSEIYSLIANMFPTLMMKDIPYKIYGNNKYKVSKAPLEVFTFWDFMEPLENQDSIKIDYQWEDMNYDTIVFRNTGAPPIMKFGDSNPETVRVPEYVEGKNLKGKVEYVPRKFSKGRTFDKEIIDKKYELVGIITLLGTTPGESGGTHYVSYIKMENDKWMYYDDMSNELKPIKFNISLLNEKEGSKPEMFIYTKKENRKDRTLENNIKIKIREREENYFLIVYDYYQKYIDDLYKLGLDHYPEIIMTYVNPDLFYFKVPNDMLKDFINEIENL